MLVWRRGSDGWKERKGARASWMIFWSSLFSRSSCLDFSSSLLLVDEPVFSVSCCSVCTPPRVTKRRICRNDVTIYETPQNVRWINEMSVKSIVHKGDAVQERTGNTQDLLQPASRKINPPEGFILIKICFCTLSGLLHGYLADK